MQTIMSQLGYKHVVGDSVKTLPKVKLNDNHSSPVVQNLDVYSQKAMRFVRHCLPLVNPC